eukprot:5759667-Amphidinium_carterae.1
MQATLPPWVAAARLPKAVPKMFPPCMCCASEYLYPTSATSSLPTYAEYSTTDPMHVRFNPFQPQS